MVKHVPSRVYGGSKNDLARLDKPMAQRVLKKLR